MARIDKPSTFQTEPESGRWGEVCEPWRLLKSSLAVKFTSKRRRIWRPESLSLDARLQIIRAIEARDAIAAAEMELRTAIRAMVHEASALPTFALDSPVWMQPDTQVRKAAIFIVRDSGWLSTRREELSSLFARIDAITNDLDLLAKGFLEVCEERSGDISMIFSLGRRLTLEPRQVERKARIIRDFVGEATGLLIDARDSLARLGEASRLAT